MVRAIIFLALVPLLCGAAPGFLQAQSFLQVKRHSDDDDAEGAEMARMEDQIDKLEGEDDDVTGNVDSDESQPPDADESGSFTQMNEHNDEEDVEGADMARMEDQIDTLEGKSCRVVICRCGTTCLATPWKHWSFK